MKARRHQDLTEEPMLPDYEMDADLEAWTPQDFDRSDEFGASSMPNRAE